MGQTDKELLLDMGFQPLRVDLALKNTGGLQDALTWLEKHQDTPDDELTASQGGSSSVAATANTEQPAGEAGEAAVAGGAEAEGGGEGKEAKSYKCNECGKMLRTWNAVQFHAEKTEHQDFEESTTEIAPLTEEEKKARLEELKAKLADKKKLQEEEKKIEAKQNEAIRRKRDQDSQKIKEELRKKEMLKDVEKKKQEKIDDMKARARIKAEIAETQRQRKETAARAKAEREGRTIETPQQQQQQQAAPSEPKAPPPAHTEARLRFQIDGRPPVVKKFSAETSLFEVGAALAAEVGMEVKSFTTMFPPKKVFKLEEPIDSGKTLKEAGLTPSGVLKVD